MSDRILGWIALVLVSILVIGAILVVAVILMLAFWWQPDCAALMEQGKECRNWPWEEVPR